MDARLSWMIELSPTHAGTLVPEMLYKIRNLSIHVNTTKLRVIWSDVCTGGRNPRSKLGVRESMGGDLFQGGVCVCGGWADSLNIIVMWRVAEINFYLMKGRQGTGGGAYFTHFPPPPPLGNYWTVPCAEHIARWMLSTFWGVCARKKKTIFICWNCAEKEAKV